MSGHKVLAVTVLLIGAIMISSCGTTQTTLQRDQQQEVVNRWTRCIERYSDQNSGSMAQAGRRASAHCEGHRRDVLSLYPAHLKNQIESLLSQRADMISTARVVKTGQRAYLDAFEGSQIDTLKKQLR